MRVPGVKAHTRRFKLRRSFGKPKRLQRKRNHCEKIRSCAFVVIVGIVELETVKFRDNLSTALDAHEVAEFMRHHVRNPAMAAADFEVPVGEPEVYGVFARDGAAVAVKCVVQDRADAWEWLVVAACDGIVNGFGVSRNFSGVCRVFNGVNELKMFRACGFPLDIALVAIKAGGACCSRQQCGTDCKNALDLKLHDCNLEFCTCPEK